MNNMSPSEAEFALPEPEHANPPISPLPPATPNDPVTPIVHAQLRGFDEEVRGEIQLANVQNPHLAAVLANVKPNWFDRRRFAVALREPMLSQVRTIGEGQVAITKIAVAARETMAREAFQQLASCAMAQGRNQTARFILEQEAQLRRAIESALERFLSDHVRGYQITQALKGYPGVSEKLLARWSASLDEFLPFIDSLRNSFRKVAEERLSA